MCGLPLFIVRCNSVFCDALVVLLRMRVLICEDGTISNQYIFSIQRNEGNKSTSKHHIHTHLVSFVHINISWTMCQKRGIINLDPPT